MKFLITAGPTREFIDTIRFISNRSTGKMGYALAKQAAESGHEVCLVTGPVALEAPEGVNVLKVVSAAEMLDMVESHIEWCDVLIMASAVADWRPADPSGWKIKKRSGTLSIQLEPTSDILKSVSSMKGERIFVGFAADDTDLEAEAVRKLKDKGLDLIVANDISKPGCGFEVDTNQVTIISREGSKRELPLMSKGDVSAEIIRTVETYQP